jgi:hypothetical protein
LSTNTGSGRFWRASYERFLCLQAKKPSAQTSTPGAIDAVPIPGEGKINQLFTSFDVIYAYKIK